MTVAKLWDSHSKESVRRTSRAILTSREGDFSFHQFFNLYSHLIKLARPDNYRVRLLKRMYDKLLLRSKPLVCNFNLPNRISDPCR